MQLVQECNWTADQRNFSKQTFKTPKGGVLEIKQVYKGKCGVAHFGLECSICSKDQELFPKGSIISVKKSLLKGQVPCGCSSNPKWSEEQNKVRVRRICEDKGYIFQGWSGEYKGIHTYLKLYNGRTGNFWESTTINNLLLGHGDPIEGAEIAISKRLLPDKYHIDKFIKEGFTGDYKFWRSDRLGKDNRKRYWYYTCPVCSNDEYVKAGVCSGIFESYENSLAEGFYACRCGRNFDYNKEQSELRIKLVCEREGLTFNSWEEDYRGVDSKFIWHCSHNHKNSTSISNFIHGARCRKCKDLKSPINGYYSKRKDEDDILYILNFNDEYIKAGRSFDMEKRFKGNRGLIAMSGCKRENIEILHLFKGKHEDVYREEQWIHEELENRGFQFKDVTWSTELFSLDCYDTLKYLLKETPLKEIDLSLL